MERGDDLLLGEALRCHGATCFFQADKPIAICIETSERIPHFSFPEVDMKLVNSYSASRNN